ncbi:restriction endonuclease [Anaerobacillus sp. MEB173]|uniref:restriction endonuclease n=1 Tax=Anaerobacillus sp. MEB173 TaxID=3383345 RepID=UPI003F91EACF
MGRRGRRRKINRNNDMTTVMGVLVIIYFVGKKVVEWLDAHSSQIILGAIIVLSIVFVYLVYKLIFSLVNVERGNRVNQKEIAISDPTRLNNNIIDSPPISLDNRERDQEIFEKWQSGQKEREREAAKQRALFESGINEIDKMSGIEFEKRMAILFSNLGYKASITPNNDFGGDIILESKDNKKTVIQCKRWNNKVDVKAVQETSTAVQFYDADEGIILTNNYLTPRARELANKVNVKVWEREKLIELLTIEEDQSLERTNYNYNKDSL